MGFLLGSVVSGWWLAVTLRYCEMEDFGYAEILICKNNDPLSLRKQTEGVSFKCFFLRRIAPFNHRFVSKTLGFAERLPIPPDGFVTLSIYRVPSCWSRV